MSEEIKRMGRPPGSKNKVFKHPSIVIQGVLLRDLNHIFKEDAVIPVDSRLLNLLAITPIDIGKFLQEKQAEETIVSVEVTDFNNPAPSP